MMPPIVDYLPPAQRERFRLAYTNKKRPIGWGEPDDIATGLVQAWLFALGFPLPKSARMDIDGGIIADGIYGSETYRAIKQFQESNPNPLKGDGMVGQDTLDKLYDRLHQKFTKQNTANPPKNAAVTVVKRPYRCPPGALICAEPPR